MRALVGGRVLNIVAVSHDIIYLVHELTTARLRRHRNQHLIVIKMTVSILVHASFSAKCSCCSVEVGRQSGPHRTTSSPVESAVPFSKGKITDIRVQAARARGAARSILEILRHSHDYHVITASEFPERRTTHSRGQDHIWRIRFFSSFFSRTI